MIRKTEHALTAKDILLGRGSASNTRGTTIQATNQRTSNNLSRYTSNQQESRYAVDRDTNESFKSKNSRISSPQRITLSYKQNPQKDKISVTGEYQTRASTYFQPKNEEEKPSYQKKVLFSRTESDAMSLKKESQTDRPTNGFKSKISSTLRKYEQRTPIKQSITALTSNSKKESKNSSTASLVQRLGSGSSQRETLMGGVSQTYVGELEKTLGEVRMQNGNLIQELENNSVETEQLKEENNTLAKQIEELRAGFEEV